MLGFVHVLVYKLQGNPNKCTDIPLRVCYNWTEWMGSCVGNICSVVISEHHFTKYAVEPPFKICLGDKCLYIKSGKIFTGGCVKNQT